MQSKFVLGLLGLSLLFTVAYFESESSSKTEIGGQCDVDSMHFYYTVSINSSPPGAKVWIGEGGKKKECIGITPVEKKYNDRKTRECELCLEGRTCKMEFKSPVGKRMDIKNILKITWPTRANVWIDGKDMNCSTPCTLVSTPYNSELIVLEPGRYICQLHSAEEEIIENNNSITFNIPELRKEKSKKVILEMNFIFLGDTDG